MSGQSWFYTEGSQSRGPISWGKLIELLRTGRISTQTPIWKEGDETRVTLDRALPAGALTPPPLSFPTPAMAEPQTLVHLWSDTTPHPWRRYFARAIDTLIYAAAVSFVIGLIFGVIGGPIARLYLGFLSSPHATLINAMLSVVYAMPLGGLVIGLTSGSIGKWLMGVRVVGPDRKPIGFLRGLNREALVWIKGLGFGIPIVILVTMALGYRNLRRNATTSWDKELGLVVLHRSRSSMQLTLEFVGVVLLVGIIVGLRRLAHVE